MDETKALLWRWVEVFLFCQKKNKPDTFVEKIRCLSSSEWDSHGCSLPLQFAEGWHLEIYLIMFSNSFLSFSLTTSVFFKLIPNLKSVFFTVFRDCSWQADRLTLFSWPSTTRMVWVMLPYVTFTPSVTD